MAVRRRGCVSPAELARTLDALLVEKVDPAALATAVAESGDLATHWAKSLEKLQIIYDAWPKLLADEGAIDLVERRNLLLSRLADRWKTQPPAGFTVAAGITTAAPAVAELGGAGRVAARRPGRPARPVARRCDERTPNGTRLARTTRDEARPRIRNII